MELNKKEINYVRAALHVYIKKKNSQLDCLHRLMEADTKDVAANKIRKEMVQRRKRDMAAAAALLERLEALTAEGGGGSKS